jgi:hypothetical protein
MDLKKDIKKDIEEFIILFTPLVKDYSLTRKEKTCFQKERHTSLW